MNAPLLVVVSGPPGAGKTALGRRLARDLGLPFVNKDGIKERLFETLGWEDRPWLRQLGRASSDLLLYFAEAALSAGCSLVVESAFWKEHATEAFLALQETCPHYPVQVHCTASAGVLVRRFLERDTSGERHPGHANRTSGRELEEALLADRYGVLEIGGTLIEVDTSDFAQVHYSALLNEIRSERSTRQGTPCSTTS
jgi:predicted kinase